VHRLTIALLAALSGCGALAGDTQVPLSPAITSPSPDPGDDAVVAIELQTGELKCSATLITPQIALTAGHCGLTATNWYDYKIFIGESIGGAGTTIDVADARPHPGFDAPTFANDLTLVFLHDPAPVAPKPVSTQAPTVGETIRVAGFGITSATASDQGTRRQGTATVSDLSPTEMTLSGSPSQPCSYDSGGPAFLTVGGTEYLAGVTSRGDTGCASYSKEVRVDAYQDYIQGYLDETAPGTKALGDRCLYDGECQTGTCLAAPDEPRVRYCSRACSGDGDCGALRCVTSQCQYPLPTPGAPGAACQADTDCIGAQCLMDSGFPQVCAPLCSPANTACSAGFQCTQIEGIRYACLAPRSGSCAFAGGGRARPGPLLWVVLLVIAWCRTGRRTSALRRSPSAS
jgi:hypothetical protein